MTNGEYQILRNRPQVTIVIFFKGVKIFIGLAPGLDANPAETKITSATKP